MIYFILIFPLPSLWFLSLERLTDIFVPIEADLADRQAPLAIIGDRLCLPPFHETSLVVRVSCLAG
jgi:hypothetical protein